MGRKGGRGKGGKGGRGKDLGKRSSIINKNEGKGRGNIYKKN